MSTEIATQGQSTSILLAPVMDVALAKQRLMQLQQFVKEYLVENEDFGIIPGTPKPTLYKPGADKLCELYGLADEYQVTQRTEDFDKGLFDYEVKCLLLRKPDMTLVSSGLGSCNSYETKYRWRDSKRVCPNCGKDAIIKGKEEYGGGWLCFAKKGGCGTKFADNDPSITGQTVGRTQNEDIADIKNTILKMSKKRAKVDAVLSATRSSGLFTQDMEDWDIPKAEPSGAISQAENRSGAPAESRTIQGATQHASASPVPNVSPRASTKRVPPSGLVAIIKAVRFFPAQDKPKLNAMVNVAFEEPLTGQNQMMPWRCDYAGCFHASLLQLLQDSVGKQGYFAIKERDKKLNVTDEWPTHFIDIEDVVSLTDLATGEIQNYVKGKPVIEGEVQ
jgi:hypothetical protein